MSAIQYTDEARLKAMQLALDERLLPGDSLPSFIIFLLWFFCDKEGRVSNKFYCLLNVVANALKSREEGPKYSANYLVLNILASVSIDRRDQWIHLSPSLRSQLKLPDAEQADKLARLAAHLKAATMDSPEDRNRILITKAIEIIFSVC
ncbi:MAG: hypothetical protein WC107_01460 [Patescibacteria group bacterium]